MSQTMQIITSKLKKNQTELFKSVESAHSPTVLRALIDELNTHNIKLYGGISKQEALYLLLYFMMSGTAYQKLEKQFGFPKSNLKQVFGAIRSALKTWCNNQIKGAAGNFVTREQSAMLAIDYDDLPTLFEFHDTEFIPTLKMDGVQIRVRKHASMRNHNCNSFKYRQKTAISFQVATDFNELVVYVSTWFGGGKQDIKQARKILNHMKIECALKDEDVFLLDCGYQGLKELPAIIPFKNPSKNSDRTLSLAQTQFNYTQRKYRSGIERTFGEIKNTYSCFGDIFNGSPDRCSELFRLACALYNMRKREQKGLQPIFF